MQPLPNEHLWFSVAPTYATHIQSALLWAEHIGHLHHLASVCDDCSQTCPKTVSAHARAHRDGSKAKFFAVLRVKQPARHRCVLEAVLEAWKMGGQQIGR
uniref:Uncharacterized protein n=1 Tax=Ralstonia solanacearum TaxID=305 RepID=A0A0S4TX45_RALSL|nr:protein of unknown function [Ralstonia solanacearum]